MITNNYHI